MSLQTKFLDFTQASFSNGALLDNGKIKSKDVVEVGYPMETPINTDGHFNNLYGRAGIISNDGRIFIPDTENYRVNIFDLQGEFLTKILFSDRPKRARIDENANEIYIFGDANLSGTGYTCVVLDLDTYVVKRNIIPSTSSPDKTLGQVQYLQDGCIGDDGYLYIYEYVTGCVQKYDKQGNWIELFYDTGKTNSHAHIEYANDYIYCFLLYPAGTAGVNKKIEIATKTETDLIDTANAHYWGEQKGFGKEMSQSFDYVLFGDKIIICPSGYYTHYEMWNLSDLSFVDEVLIHIWGGKKGQHYGDCNRTNNTSAFPLGIQATYNNVLKKILFTHQTYAVVMNTRIDQTALWQNQSFGGAGTIKQINVKDNGIGTRNWYIKKSSDSTWQQFEPNLYTTSILELSATETFDIKVEMGNFYEPVKDQIEIEEITILFDLQISLPTVENLTVINETSTIVLEWDCSVSIPFQIEHSKSINGEWEIVGIANTTTFSFPISNNDEMQIPHYFRVLGEFGDSYTEPSNIAMAIPNRENNSNFYQVCHQALLSILQNDTRLSEIKEWLSHEPQKTTIKHNIIAWIEYKGEVLNDWVAFGEREVQMQFDIGVLQKNVSRKERYFAYTDDLLFKIREILYEQNNRSLNDYIYDMEFGERIHFRNKDNHTISIISVILKKRFRR